MEISRGVVLRLFYHLPQRKALPPPLRRRQNRRCSSKSIRRCSSNRRGIRRHCPLALLLFGFGYALAVNRRSRGHVEQKRNILGGRRGQKSNRWRTSRRVNTAASRGSARLRPLPQRPNDDFELCWVPFATIPYSRSLLQQLASLLSSTDRCICRGNAHMRTLC